MKHIQLHTHKIGILGGMGPQASCELLRLIIAKAISTFGVRDCDEFPEIVLDSIPVTDFISNQKALRSARATIINRAKQLKIIGCNPIVMACNTAHIMESDIKQEIETEFMSLIEIMAKETLKRKMKKVCVFATPTTIKNDLYGKAFRHLGMSVINPDKKTQVILERIIRNVISGKTTKSDREIILKTAFKLIDSRLVDGVILGCTELPVITSNINHPKILNSLEVLADNLLDAYYAS
jgi:aspartate racemase